MSIEYLYRVCNLECKYDHDSLQYYICDKGNYINCVNVSNQTHEKSKDNYLTRDCSFCINEMPFSKMPNNDLKIYRHTAKPTSSFKNVYLKNTTEIIKHFDEKNQIFENNKNPVRCNYIVLKSSTNLT